jgi:hypothetical protein
MLYAWLKAKDPSRAEELLEKLVIVHDELEGSVLFFLWAMGGGNLKVRQEEFEGATSAREAFKNVNDAHGQPLKLIARKTEGYGADYYEPK